MIADRLVDDMIDAHDDWLEECLRVRDCYSRWTAASREHAEGAFTAYMSALEREESAAARYRELATRFRRTELAQVGAQQPPLS